MPRNGSNLPKLKTKRSKSEKKYTIAQMRASGFNSILDSAVSSVTIKYKQAKIFYYFMTLLSTITLIMPGVISTLEMPQKLKNNLILSFSVIAAIVKIIERAIKVEGKYQRLKSDAKALRRYRTNLVVFGGILKHELALLTELCSRHVSEFSEDWEVTDPDAFFDEVDSTPTPQTPQCIYSDFISAFSCKISINEAMRRMAAYFNTDFKQLLTFTFTCIRDSTAIDRMALRQIVQWIDASNHCASQDEYDVLTASGKAIIESLNQVPPFRPTHFLDLTTHTITKPFEPTSILPIDESETIEAVAMRFAYPAAALVDDESNEV